MALGSASDKLSVIKQYQLKENDTGSPEVQVALLTKRLETLSSHFANNAHDNHSRRGMMKLISRRKSLLDFLRREDVERYRTLISSLGLRK
ncbi:MAG: 30S ribosomal protein S15 [SAR324 cluster bacterium]|uniref:Small ribosomal subunit protein uS15 n=1 Tax=SAR324 cluster bacterium TaxID=2024889 RepID=A0A7X9FNV0_9DELT|nr:30S ribosomal protein S15 [SAR324 cluster bacterium]